MAARIELLLLAAIMKASAGSLFQNSGDPIFALIQAHRRANVAPRSRHLEDELVRTLFATEPTTVAGAAALMTYVIELIERSDGRPADWWSLPLHRTVTRALAKIYERTAQPPDLPG